MGDLILSLSTYKELAYAWIGLAVVIFFVLLKVTAPYGRHTKQHWGPVISNRWGWVIMEFTVLVMLWVLILPQWRNFSVEAFIMLGLFISHYLHRSLIFPFRLNTRGKTIPLVIVLSGVAFNLVNGFLLGYYFAHFQHYPTHWFLDFRFILGCLMFVGGFYINFRADNYLIRLRKPGETHYVLPRGWLFERISCPNLFGELVEWLGFAIMCWNLPALAFFIWTAANLIPRALSHHRWYRLKFPEYPKERKAVIPYLL